MTGGRERGALYKETHQYCGALGDAAGSAFFFAFFCKTLHVATLRPPVLEGKRATSSLQAPAGSPSGSVSRKHRASRLARIRSAASAGNQAAEAGPSSATRGILFRYGPQDEEGGGSFGFEHAHSAPKPTPARSSRREEHRGEWRAEAPELWGKAQQWFVSPSSPK
ncbi:hypothetical protein NDU88_006415 [Pleurodeles waltl]|uniref:Uncharacterized protein n=1 Tax=Pleurodeles waltl TaxID=8319 RepID=A0AAV7ULJ7_PLEWA|nr:hypothetical protein NDU88_006415 [Pleurodeles waltl]